MDYIDIDRSRSGIYRYKMPRLIVKIEGEDNDIKTVFVNMFDIGECLHRKVRIITKYLGFEVGAQTKFDFSKKRYIIYGAYDESLLQELLYGFIERFVLCPKCKTPNTQLICRLPKLTISCFYHDITFEDHTNLFPFIQSAFDDPLAYKASLTISKNEGNKSNEENGQKGENAEDTIPTFSGLTIKSKTSVANSQNDYFEPWSDIEETYETLSDNNNNENLGIKTGKTEKTQTPINIFYNYVKKLKESGEFSSLPKNGNRDLDKEIYGEAVKLGLKDKAPMVLAELLFDSDILNQIKRFQTLFYRFCLFNLRAQKYLMSAFEKLIGSQYKSALLPKAAYILKVAYVANLLEEDTLIYWYYKVSEKYMDKETAIEIRKQAEPFIDWLCTVESASALSESELEGSCSSSDDYVEESDYELLVEINSNME